MYFVSQLNGLTICQPDQNSFTEMLQRSVYTILGGDLFATHTNDSTVKSLVKAQLLPETTRINTNALKSARNAERNGS